MGIQKKKKKERNNKKEPPLYCFRKAPDSTRGISFGFLRWKERNAEREMKRFCWRAPCWFIQNFSTCWNNDRSLSSRHLLSEPAASEFPVRHHTFSSDRQSNGKAIPIVQFLLGGLCVCIRLYTQPFVSCCGNRLSEYLTTLVIGPIPLLC